MCYTYIMTEVLDHLDDVLARVHSARQRPAWRRRLFEGQNAVTSVSVLRALRAVELGQDSPGVSVGDVADYMVVEHSTASRLVGRLVESGLLAKANSPQDQRRCMLHLTDVGRKALDAITNRRRQMVAEAVAGWSTNDVEALLGLLDRLADDFERGGVS